MTWTALELLEARRLMAVDLTLTVNLTVGTHKPGASGVYGAVTAFKGTAAASLTTNFTVEAHLSSNTIYGDSDDIFGTTFVITDDILTNFGTAEPFAFNIGASVPAGSYYVVCKGDTTNAIAESNENNNTVAGNVGMVTKLDGTVPVYGTNAADSITVAYLNASFYNVTINGVTSKLLHDQSPALDVQGYGGDDVIVMTGLLPPVNLFAGDGNDTVVGSDGGDFLAGGAGLDRIFGGLGNDRLNGNGGHDRLYGEAGGDRLYGYDGNDYIDGGSSNDRLEGGAGLDSFFGQSGNDRIFSTDGLAEFLYGGSGSTDTATQDPSDVLSSVELPI